MKKVLASTLLLCFFLQGFSQRDTAFWFAAPDISSAFSYDRPVYLRLTSYQQPCTIKVFLPANPGFPAQILSLGAFTTQSIDLTPWIGLLECAPGNAVQNKGLKIESSNNIAAYYEVNVGGPNPEFFSLKGRNALGSNFFISSQHILANSPFHNPVPISSFNIAASENNTVVTITPTANIVGHAGNSTFSVTLNKGQTYAAIASSQAAANHLQGSRVTSSKPVAITVSDDLLYGLAVGGACEDLAGDQIVPVNFLGTEYVGIRASLNGAGDQLYIMGTQNGTNVQINGVSVTTLNAGQSQGFSMTAPACFVQGSAPLYVYQLTGTGCEVGSALLPKLSCTGSSSVSVARSASYDLYLSLLVRSNGVGNFLINNVAGVITAADFSPVPATGGQWYFARKYLSDFSYPVGSVIKVTNTSGLFQMGFMQTGTPGTGFGYFSDYNSVIAEASATDTTLCPGATLNLVAETVAGGSYSWTGPASFSSSQQNPSISNVNFSNSGSYVLTVAIPDCGTFTSTVQVAVAPSPLTEVTHAICEGQSFLGYTTTGDYTNIFTSSEGCDSTRILHLTVRPNSSSSIFREICAGQNYEGYTSTGTYLNTFVAANGCDSVRTLNLVVKPTFSTGQTQAICEGQSFEGHSTSGTYTSVFTSANGCDSTHTLVLIVNPNATLSLNASICDGESYEGYSVPGTYTDHFTAVNGCDSMRTLNLVVHPKPVTTVSTTICEGQTYAGHSVPGTYTDVYMSVFGCDSTRTLFLAVKPKSFHNVVADICAGALYEGYSSSGVYHDTLTAVNGCDSIRTLTLTVRPAPTFFIVKEICHGETFEGYNSAGNYVDIFQAANGCDSTRNLQLTVKDLPLPNLGKDTALCSENSLLLSPGIFDSYLWHDGTTSPQFTVSGVGIYAVTVTNFCGSAKDEILVTNGDCSYYFPNVFTPNGDGQNDFFRILNPQNITKFSLTTYNRWGEKVFETSDVRKGWNGMYRNQAAPMGEYVWYASFFKGTKPVSLKGFVLLMK